MDVLLFVQIILSLFLIALVIIQSQSSGLGRSVAGGAQYRSKKGLERSVFIMTILVGFLFALVSLANVLI